MAEKLALASTQNLESAVLNAAKTALKKINISIPPDHPLFSDLTDFANGRKKPKETVEQDFQNAGKAKQFVSTFVAELKKAGVYDQYAKTMDARADGTTVVFTQKGAAEKSSPSIGEAIALRPLRSAIDTAADKVGVELPGADVADFIQGCSQYLVAKKNKELHGGVTLLLKFGPEKQATDFASAFKEAFKNSRTGLDVIVEVSKDFANKYTVLLKTPPLTTTVFTGNE